MSHRNMSRAPEPVGLELDILRTRTLSSIVEREIGRMVYDGELTVGDHINEYTLAARLGVSRGPVREACRKLEQAGLLRCVVNRGMFVRDFTPQEVMELYDLRASLIGYAARRVAKGITRDQVSVLDRLVEHMEVAAQRGDCEAYYPINLNFHTAVLAFGGCARILNIYTETDTVLHLFRRRRPLSSSEMIIANGEHRAMVKAFRMRNGSRCALLMEQHAQSGKVRIGLSLEGTLPAPVGKPPAAAETVREQR